MNAEMFVAPEPDPVLTDEENRPQPAGQGSWKAGDITGVHSHRSDQVTVELVDDDGSTRKETHFVDMTQFQRLEEAFFHSQRDARAIFEEEFGEATLVSDE